MYIPYEMLETPDYMNMYQKAINALRRNFSGFEGLLRKNFDFFISMINLIMSITICTFISNWYILVIIIFSILNCITNVLAVKNKYQVIASSTADERYLNTIDKMLFDFKYQINYRVY